MRKEWWARGADECYLWDDQRSIDKGGVISL